LPRFEHYRATHPCPICASLEALLVASKCRSGEPLNTVMCLGCGLGRRDPLPADEDLFVYYSQNYRAEIGKGRKPTKRRLWRIAACAAGRSDDVLGRGAGPATLDFGCGASEFVYLLGRAGCASRGFDPDSSHIAWAQSTLGVNVEHQAYKTVAVEPGSIDLVTMYHVLEHIPDPADALRHCHLWLKEGGMLVVEVPNFISVQQAPGNQFIKGHLFYFHREALCALARRCGFVCESSGVYDRGENIRCYFRKAARADKSTGWMPAGVAATRAVLEAHGRLAHYTTLAPYKRMWMKLSRNIAEAAHTFGKDELSILDFHARRLKSKCSKPSDTGVAVR
jgi:2-polyprenyl-3-methyl-5-hydroxy-6-metoxy-1,4-benzoquinol methylase